jgi:hypothetical protein
MDSVFPGQPLDTPHIRGIACALRTLNPFSPHSLLPRSEFHCIVQLPLMKTAQRRESPRGYEELSGAVDLQGCPAPRIDLCPLDIYYLKGRSNYPGMRESLSSFLNCQHTTERQPITNTAGVR